MAHCSWYFAVFALLLIATGRQSSAAVLVSGNVTLPEEEADVSQQNATAEVTEVGEETDLKPELVECFENEPEVEEDEIDTELIEKVVGKMYSEPQFLALGSVFEEGVMKILSSFSEVEEAAEGMANNVEKFIENAGRQLFNDLSDYAPLMKEFYSAVPAEAYHKFVLDSLITLNAHVKDHCGQVALEHNPIHPGLKLESSRRRRSSQVWTLATLGQSFSNWMTNIDNFVVEYLTKSIPITCNMIELMLQESIQKVEKMKPEEFKKKW